MGSLFHELVRRNVIRGAALYLAATWLILQVADIVLDAFEAPSAIMRLLIVAFTAGFPVFLLLSWFYEFRGARLVKDTGVSAETSRPWTARATNVTIAVLVILSAGIYFFSQAQVAREPASPDTLQQGVAGSEVAIAILPFTSISPDPADKYLADGVTDELLNVLSSAPNLRVIARASTFALEGAEKDVRELGEQLGVEYILRGSVRRDGDRVRISVQLVETRTGDMLWSAPFDRELAGIFEIQEEIAERVSGTLQLSLFSDPTTIIRRTTPEGYTAYLRALYIYRTSGRDGYAEAVAELEKVLALDDQYAPAWSLLSSIRHNQAINGEIDYVEGNELARESIERALAIDSNYAYAISSRGWLAMAYERDFRLAAQQFRRALELAPNDPAILNSLAVLARTLGQIDRAIELTSQVLEQNPLAAGAFNNLSDQLYQARRYAEAIESARRALELAPGSPTATVNLAVTEILVEKPETALETIAVLEIPFYVLFIEALAHFDLGDRATSDAALAALTEGYDGQRAAYIAALHAYRGEIEEAFGFLQRAIDERQRTLAMRTEPLYENLRGDPRWQRVLEQLGLSDQQVADIEI
jgi:TolB-like protein/Tfp pilus assembly protein PilF